MQTRAITDPPARAAMESMRTRIEALGTVHRRLYQSTNVKLFDIGEFARDLVQELVLGSGRDIRLHLALDVVHIPVEKASPVALIMNELITNALKHAFLDERQGRLWVTVEKDGTYAGIRIADDGVGMPGTARTKTTFGTRMTETLARQLNAIITWTSNDPGTVANIRLPIEAAGRADAP